MPLIGYPIGDLDEHFIISEIYKPQDFEAGWYFIPTNFPSYNFVSVDYDPNINEVVQDGDKFYIQGFDPYIENINFPEGYNPLKKEFVRDSYFIYPSGVPYQFTMGYYWEMFGDLNSPYLFIPYFDPNTYGEIAWLDFNTPLETLKVTLSFVETVLKGLIFPFKERVVIDNSSKLKLKEKIVSLLSCDIDLISTNTLRLRWFGEEVNEIEVLRKELSDNDFTVIAVPTFDQGEYIFQIDNNSYIYSVRGANGTGMSNVEITIGVKGKTTVQTLINLGDFVKIYEGNVNFKEIFEADILI